MTCILVADDDPDIRMLIALRLQHAGYGVLEAADGNEALRMAQHHGLIDLLILDINMPGRTGLEVLMELRRGALDTRPVILLSAMARPDDVSAGLAAGASRYLTKPFRLQELSQTVAELIPA